MTEGTVVYRPGWIINDHRKPDQEVAELKARVAFLEAALKQAADNYFIVATLEEEIPKYTVSRDYIGQEVIILDGYSEQSFVATTEQLPELAQYLKERP